MTTIHSLDVPGARLHCEALLDALGADSGRLDTYQTSAAVAELLSTSAVEFPGGSRRFGTFG